VPLLEALDLSSNGIEDAGGAALAAALAHLPRLKTLHLGDNEISDARPFADALRSVPQLASLLIFPGSAGVSIGDEGAALLRAAAASAGMGALDVVWEQ
jgi:Leucine Rich repeat